MYSDEYNVNNNNNNYYYYYQYYNNNNIRNHEFHSIQHYVIKFIGDFRQVSAFYHVLRFSPPIKLTESV